jgi:NodT family efflux transporter outer membrane factor (OMF) lipoprotein
MPSSGTLDRCAPVLANDKKTTGDCTVKRQPWQQGFSLLILTTLLGGCAGFGPDHKAADLLTADQLALSAKSAHAPAQGWWHQLQDPQLDQLIETAHQHSPSLKLVEDRLQEARNAAGLSESQLGPKVDLEAGNVRERFSTNGYMPAPIGGNFYNSYTLSLNASWELDFWGKNHAKVRAALGAMQAAALETQQARLLLTQAVIAQYTEIQRQQQLQRINLQRLQLIGTRISLMQARVSAGLLSADTVQQAEMSKTRLQASNAEIQGNLQRARHALAALTGQAPNALDALKPATLGEPPRVVEAAVTSDLLGRRPDIASQRALVEAMSENVKAARAEFYPNVSLSGVLGYNSVDLSTLLEHSSRIVTFAPALSLPLFHSGQLQANLKGQQSRYDQAVDTYNQTLLNGLKDAADALSSQQQTHAQLLQAHKGFDASKKAADAMLLRLRAGMVSKLDVLDSQDTALSMQGNQLEAQAGARLAWAKLNTALGGGLATVATPVKD